MRALPGPAGARPASSGRRGFSNPFAGQFGGDGYVPQPRVWLIPVGLSVMLIGGSWVCDTASAWLARVTGSGSPTHYLPVTLWILGGLAVAALALFVREFLRRADEDAAPPSTLPVGMGAEDIGAWIVAAWAAAGAPPRAATVTAEVRDIPKALAAEPSITYPTPDLVIDADVIP